MCAGELSSPWRTLWRAASNHDLRYERRRKRSYISLALCSKSMLLEQISFFPCRACTACRDSCKRTNTFSSHVTGKKYDIRQLSTCSSSNVVYLISCPCGLQYVGKTTRQIRTRIIEHKSAIRKIDEKFPIARHFRDANHPISSLTFCVIQQIKTPRGGGGYGTPAATGRV